jgi:acid phosphatase type 7
VTRRMALAAVSACLALAGAGCSSGDPPPRAHTSPGAFPTPHRSPTPTLWAVGDGDGSAPSARIAALIARDRPTAFLYLGDVYEGGSAGDFRRDYAPTFGRLRSLTLPTPGNHDWDQRGAGYRPYWGRLTHGRPPSHYAVSIGGWQIVSVSSEDGRDPKAAQVRWLKRRLAGSGTCRIVFWHRPRFSAGMHGDQPDVDPLWRAVVGRAALVLNGHDHDMQRLAPVDGTTEVVSGAGGHGLYRVDRADTRVTWFNDRTYGALRIRLLRRRAALAFVAESGRVLNRFSVRCRPAE